MKPRTLEELAEYYGYQDESLDELRESLARCESEADSLYTEAREKDKETDVIKALIESRASEAR